MRRNEDMDGVNSSQTEGNEDSFDMKQSSNEFTNDVSNKFF